MDSPLNQPTMSSLSRTTPTLVIVLAITAVAAVLPSLSRFTHRTSATNGFYDTTIVALAFAIIIVGFCLVILTLMRRISGLEQNRDIESHAALHDPLTGAANRRQFDQRLEHLRADEKPAHTLLMIDLDRFKPVNDLYGHAAGDELLQEITKGLQRIVRPDDTVARLGGDEFAMLLAGKTSSSAEATALAVLEFVRKYRLNWEGQRISVGASIGLVRMEHTGLTSATILAAADEALYMAKEAGRGAVFSAELSEDLSRAESFRRVDSGTPEPVSSARSHEPEDGRRQELNGTLMLCLNSSGSDERRRLNGARRRHEITHWVSVEPMTIGSTRSPGLMMHDLLVDAAARSDGGADFARWMLGMALTAVSNLSPADSGRVGVVLPLPARAFVAVPGLADELMRLNALSYRPIRHLTIVLHNISSVYASPAIKDAQERFKLSDVRLGFEIRASSLDVLAPLRYVNYDEIHLGRELIRNLRPGGSSNATIEALLAVVDTRNTTLVASGVDSNEVVQHLTKMGVKRFSGKVLGSMEPLHEVLRRVGTSTA